MKHFLYVGCLALSASLTASAQTIEVPSGTPLTIQGNLNLPTGFSVQLNNANYIKAPATGSGNVYMGLDAGTSGQGTANTFLGNSAGRVSTGGNNVFVGAGAGYSNTSGQANVFIGANAGVANTTGIANMFMGQLAGANNAGGSYNLFIGNGTGINNTGGVGNTFIGDGAGNGNSTGQNNTYIGRSAGLSNNATGQGNTFIGFQARSAVAAVNNSVAIGTDAIVNASNAIVLGGTGPASVNVGIGTAIPTARLEVVSGTSGISGLKLTNLTSNNAATMTSVTKFLTVNGNGEVILASLNGSAREGVADSFWKRNGSLLQSTQDDAIVIGNNARTPAGYKLFVEQGILTEKVKVALKNTSDWSDYVFQSDYKLKSLSEVENFIQANKHLPGVPSAQEMVEKGNDLHKTDAKLLEKIEELTLYSIQQQKEIDQLKQLVKQLVEKK
ncbi:hypothetical protein GCM10027592_14650 [Spirosoma flavus]